MSACLVSPPSPLPRVWRLPQRLTDLPLPAPSWYAAIRALAQLSSVPPSILPSALFPPSSKPFFARQVGTLLRISGVQAAVDGVGEILRDAAERAQVLSFLKDGAQVVDRWEGGRKAIVWGDGKIDNMVFAEGGPEVVGILDWELCAIGQSSPGALLDDVLAR